MHSNKLYELEPRQRIFNYIKKNPGLHLRELSRKINIPKTTLRYHLRFLKKQNLIAVKSEGVYRRIHVIDKLGTRDREILNLLRQEVPCKILLYLSSLIICSQIELSKELDKSPTTIEFHLKKLVDMDIIKPTTIENGFICRRKDSSYIRGRSPVKSEIIYRLKDHDTYLVIHRLLVKYGASFPDQKTIAIIINDNKTVDMSKDLPKIINHFNLGIKETLDALYEIFPHPYHI